MFIFAFLFPILVIILLFKVSSLSGEVKKVKSDILKLSQAFKNTSPQGVNMTATATPSMNPVSTVAPTAPVTPQPSPILQTSDSVSLDTRFGNWLKENWLLKLGVLMILIAFGWFMSYAFVHNWIGPVGRVVLGFVVGTLLALFGSSRMSKNTTQGVLFLVLGSAITVITSFAAQVVYKFFSPEIALFIPFIVSLFVATVASVYNNMNLGIYAIVIGFLAPLLTHGVRIDENLLAIYLLIVTLACVWLSFRKNWRVINVVSLVGVFLHALGLIDSGLGGFALLALFALAGVYFLVSILGIVISKMDVSQSDVAVAVINSVFVLTLIFAEIREEFQSLVCALVMLVFAFGSLFVFTKTRKQTFFYVYSLIAIVFLVTATALELEGHALTFALAIESASIALLSFLVTRSVTVGLKMSVLMIVPLILGLNSFFASSWQNGVIHEDFFIVFLVGFLFMVIGFFFKLMIQNGSPKAEGDDSLIETHLILGGVFFVGLLWNAVHAGIQNQSVATMVALVVYTLVGIALYFSGNEFHNKAQRYFGGALLGLVVARLLIVDVWNMPLAPRIVVFVLIGTLFISTAFIIKNKKEIQN